VGREMGRGGVEPFERGRLVVLAPLVTVMDAELSVLVVCRERGALFGITVDIGRLARLPFGSRRRRAAGDDSVWDNDVRFLPGDDALTFAVAAFCKWSGWWICCDDRGDSGGEMV
jgi:hypothetical protein